MPSFLSVFEDTSPYFFYSGIWRVGSSADGSLNDQYSDGSVTVTNQTDATLSFQYYGTSVSIFGSKRETHGRYQVTIDGVVHPEEDGRPSAGSPDEFNATIVNESLGQSTHTVRLVNKEDRILDVDTIAWETKIGLDDEPLIVNTIQDNHPSFLYQPANAWTTTPPGFASFSGRSGHGTSQEGATAELSFTGDCIALFGPVGPDAAAAYTARINGEDGRRFSAERDFRRTKQLLFWAGGLGPGNHTLRVTVDTTGENRVFAIDYAEVYTTPSLGGSFDGTQAPVVIQQPTQSGDATANTKGLPTGAIVGLALVSVIAILALFALASIFLIRRRKRNLAAAGPAVTPLSLPITDLQQPVTPFLNMPLTANHSANNLVIPQTATTGVSHIYPYGNTSPIVSASHASGLPLTIERQLAVHGRANSSDASSGQASSANTGGYQHLPPGVYQKQREISGNPSSSGQPVNRLSQTQSEAPPPAYNLQDTGSSS